jgi:hypothetical protein
MPPWPQTWVPHLRDGSIVAKVGIERSETAPAHLHPAQTRKAEVTY